MLLRVLGIFVWLLALGCYAGVAKAVDVDADVYQRMIEQGYVSKDDVKIYKNIKISYDIKVIFAHTNFNLYAIL